MALNGSAAESAPKIGTKVGTDLSTARAGAMMMRSFLLGIGRRFSVDDRETAQDGNRNPPESRQLTGFQIRIAVDEFVVVLEPVDPPGP